MKDLKVVFMGTPEFGVPILEALVEKCNVIGVVTQPDKEVGRKRVLTPSPVKVCALKHNIPVFQPTTFKDESVVAELSALNPDVIVVVAYGKILPKISSKICDKILGKFEQIQNFHFLLEQIRIK